MSFKNYLRATLKDLVAVLLEVLWEVTATVTLYKTPEASVPVEISVVATEDLTFLLSKVVPSLSLLVVISILMPVLGILELSVTLNV